MKKNWLSTHVFFGGLLFVLIALRLALAQAVDEQTVGWDLASCWDCYGDGLQEIMLWMILAPVAGTIVGFARVMGQSSRRPLVEPLRLK